MKIIFCTDPLNPSYPDEMYRAEARAAEAAGFEYALVDFDRLVSGDAAQAVRRVPAGNREYALYRGWMLTPERYTALYNALCTKGVILINDPAAYKHCHHLPESYPVIEGHTPQSVWTRDLSIGAIMAALATFGDKPVIVKDFVKSQKHYWFEACYIPAASSRSDVERVVTRFLDLQGDGLNEGLVFREFVEFEPLGTHPESGMPLTGEYRLFILDGEPLLTTEYWEGDYSGSPPPVEQFRDVIGAVQSRFFTMDIARLQGGDWRIIELGDGQVAGLPESADVAAFYARLAQ